MIEGWCKLRRPRLDAQSIVPLFELSYALTGVALERFGILAAGLVIATISLLCGMPWLEQLGRPRMVQGME